MKTGKNLLVVLLVITLSVLACSLPGITATDEPAPPEEQPPLQTSEVEVAGAIPLPEGLTIISSPSLLIVDFQDENNGWGVSNSGNGHILRTQDGGSTWLDVTPAELSADSYSIRISLLDVNTAWALIPGDDFYSGTLYRSLDGGASWTSNPVPFFLGRPAVPGCLHRAHPRRSRCRSGLQCC